MTLKQLEYFLEIARMGSVSKAAQMLNISQPPLSMQLKALEDELGVPLFNRTKRGLEITPEGTLLQERAEVIMAFLQETTHDLHKFSNAKECTLRIGSIGSSPSSSAIVAISVRLIGSLGIAEMMSVMIVSNCGLYWYSSS